MADDAATATHPTAFLNKTLTALSYIWWPIGILLKYIAALTLYLAKLLYWPVAFLLQPVIYLARFILTCLLAPFRLLVKLEVRILKTTTHFLKSFLTTISDTLHLPRHSSSSRPNYRSHHQPHLRLPLEHDRFQRCSSRRRGAIPTALSKGVPRDEEAQETEPTTFRRSSRHSVPRPDFIPCPSRAA